MAGTTPKLGLTTLEDADNARTALTTHWNGNAAILDNATLNPMTAAEDLIKGGASGAMTRLPKGTDGQELGLLGGVLGWRTVPACRVYRTTAQSLTSGTATAIAFDAERFDTDAMHDNVTANSRLVARTAGTYLIAATIAFAGGGGTFRQMQFFVNGASAIAMQLMPPVGGGGVTVIALSTVWSFAVGQYVEVFATQDSGAPLNVNASANYSPECSMVRIG